MYTFDEIEKTDSEIADAIKAEMERQNSHIELIASENWVSKAVMAAMGSPLTNKYAERIAGTWERICHGILYLRHVWSAYSTYPHQDISVSYD